MKQIDIATLEAALRKAGIAVNITPNQGKNVPQRHRAKRRQPLTTDVKLHRSLEALFRTGSAGLTGSMALREFNISNLANYISILKCEHQIEFLRISDIHHPEDSTFTVKYSFKNRSEAQKAAELLAQLQEVLRLPALPPSMLQKLVDQFPVNCPV